MVTTTPTVPEPPTQRPLPPVRAGDPQRTDADPQTVGQQRAKLSRREVKVLAGNHTGWTQSALARYLGINEGTVKTSHGANPAGIRRRRPTHTIHPHHFPRSIK